MLQELKWPAIAEPALVHAIEQPLYKTAAVTVHALLLQHNDAAVPTKRMRDGVDSRRHHCCCLPHRCWLHCMPPLA